MGAAKAKRVERDSYRVEWAKDLLVSWAWWNFQREVRGETVEVLAGNCGSAFKAPTEAFEVYAPVGFKLKTNASQTRNKGSSRACLGSSDGGITREQRIRAINRLFVEEFSGRQIMVLMAMFLPPEAYGGEKKLSDAKVARTLGFKPNRACELKKQAVDKVVSFVLGGQ